MKRLNQSGTTDAWFIGFVIVLVLFFGATSFAVWAFMGRSDYKNNVDEKISTAVEAANKELGTVKDKEFAEKEKQPNRTYTGPAAYGTVSISYPKTWSVYVDESGKGSIPLDGYLNPNTVPGLQSGASFATRVQVTSTAYDQEVKRFDSFVKAGKLKASAFRADKVKDIVGIRMEGEVVVGKQGILVILPLRDKTLKVWTESTQFANDFQNTILPSLSFIP